MKVLKIRALRGPNLWSQHTSIEATVFCNDSENKINSLNGFETRLRERFPEIPLLQTAGRHDSITLAHVLELTTLTLQAQIGCPITFSCTANTPELNTYRVIVEYTEEKVGRLAFEDALQLCTAAIEDTPFNLTDVLSRLRNLYEDIRLGPSTGSIVNAAIARNIPVRRLTNGSLVQFGWGASNAEFKHLKATKQTQLPNQLYKIRN